jgi:hypothetical protein
MKRSHDDHGLKALLADAGLEKDAGAERVLSEIFRSPVLSSVEAPPGYENRLLSALNEKLPPAQAAKKAKPVEAEGGFFGILRIPQLAWGFMGVAVTALVFSLGGRLEKDNTPASEDYLVQTARKDPAAVSNWLASIGETRARRVAAADIDLSNEDPEVVEKALQDVARQMGMK